MDDSILLFGLSCRDNLVNKIFLFKCKIHLTISGMANHVKDHVKGLFFFFFKRPVPFLSIGCI